MMKNSVLTNGILFAAVYIVFCLFIAVLVIVVVKKVKKRSRAIFGTDSVSEGIKRQRELMSETPRSLHSMTSVYLPMIMRDFPEFDYSLYKSKAQSLLRSYFNAVESKKASALSEEYSNTLKNNVIGIIEDLNSRNVKQVYDRAVFHDVQIAKYIKTGKTAEIVFEISAGYYAYTVDGSGAVIFGDKNLKTQTVYEVGLMYVQDADSVEAHADALGINCPNCGAPIKNLGEKYCEYCGTAVAEINIRAWRFSFVREQTARQRQF